MTRGTPLLNNDGTASMATLLMMSHHAFRRDLTQFGDAIEKILENNISRLGPVKEEWVKFREALHGHHTIEDTALFPDLSLRSQEIKASIERLAADHEKVSLLLNAGDSAFANLPHDKTAGNVIAKLEILLDAHLTFEEEAIVPFLRVAKDFPSPSGEKEIPMYAEGFAWSSYGIAPEVLVRVDAMLPAALSERLPLAREQFAERCLRVWGASHAAVSYTSVPFRE